MCYTNCVHASNLFNIIIHDVLEAKKHNEIKHALFWTNDKCKTSLIYGKKIIVVNEEFYEQLKAFIKHIRVRLIDDKVEENKLRYLFTSSAKKTVSLQMTPSLVSQCLTRTFEKSQVFCHVKNRYKIYPLQGKDFKI